MAVRIALFISLAAFAVLQATSSSASLLYPYGPGKDSVCSKADDGSSPLIKLNSSIKLFGNVSSSLYVNHNGLLSFASSIVDFTPRDLPVINSNPFLAPFWADVNNAIAGDIYYRQSTDSDLLSQASSDIRSYFNVSSFSASLVFVATWHNVAYYGSSSSSSVVNTFQAVLCANGSLTFVMFNYERIAWTTGTLSSGDSKGLGGTPALAGVNSGSYTGYYKIPGSQSADIINITSTSNVNFPGRWVFRVDNLHPEDASGVVGKVHA